MLLFLSNNKYLFNANIFYLPNSTKQNSTIISKYTTFEKGIPINVNSKGLKLALVLSYKVKRKLTNKKKTERIKETDQKSKDPNQRKSFLKKNITWCILLFCVCFQNVPAYVMVEIV